MKLAIEGGQPVRSKENFLVFGAPLIENDEIEEVVDSLKKRWIGTGPKVHQFENLFREYKGSSHALALNSCTAALHLSLIACGVGPGDEVITSPMTFCATVNAIIHTGATPVLVDCELDTFNIDPKKIEEKINAKTKAILPVHFAGRSCAMDEITLIANTYDLLLIEDCAHAIETEYKGKKAGTFGDVGCFSFYATKNIVTGEGGMVLTNDDRIAGRVKVLGLHGMSKDAWKRFSDEGYKHYQVIQAGFKYNMMDLQAALGIHQIKRIDAYWNRRKEIWEKYNDAFADLPLILPKKPEPGTRHAFHLYTPLIDVDKLRRTRDWVLDALTAENIGVGVHYLPIQSHPYYRKTYGWYDKDYPNAAWIGGRTLSLPLSPALTNDDVADVINAVIKVTKQ